MTAQYTGAGAAPSSPQFIGSAPFLAYRTRISGCSNTAMQIEQLIRTRRVLLDFSLATVLAIAIGLAVGALAVALVWLITMLNA
jgi:uncharacterized membrane protein YqgA involved in biofilm formation